MNFIPVLFKSEVPVHKKWAININAMSPFDLFEFPSSIATPAITVQATWFKVNAAAKKALNLRYDSCVWLRLMSHKDFNEPCEV